MTQETKEPACAPFYKELSHGQEKTPARIARSGGLISNAHLRLFPGQERKKARTLELGVLPHHFHDRPALNKFRPTGIVMNSFCVDGLLNHAVVSVSGTVLTVNGIVVLVTGVVVLSIY